VAESAAPQRAREAAATHRSGAAARRCQARDERRPAGLSQVRTWHQLWRRLAMDPWGLATEMERRWRDRAEQAAFWLSQRWLSIAGHRASLSQGRAPLRPCLPSFLSRSGRGHPALQGRAVVYDITALDDIRDALAETLTTATARRSLQPIHGTPVNGRIGALRWAGHHVAAIIIPGQRAPIGVRALSPVYSEAGVDRVDRRPVHLRIRGRRARSYVNYLATYPIPVRPRAICLVVDV
jgi:hypothetical protein